MRIAIVGPGRMGTTVGAIARERGHVVAAEIDIGQLSGDSVGEVDVAIEFTQPDAAASNLRQLAGFGIPTVCGTTGWYDELPAVTQAFESAGVGLVYAPNFSLGVQVMMRVARRVAEVIRDRPEFDAYLLETHHRHKQDAPSGTGRAVREVLRTADPSRDYPITSVRAGEVPGTHELRVDAAGESLAIVHEARDRTIFARGAVLGAEWLTAERRQGVFRFDDFILGAIP